MEVKMKSLNKSNGSAFRDPTDLIVKVLLSKKNLVQFPQLQFIVYI